MVGLTISSLPMVNFAINILTILILPIITSFMFILIIINFFIIGFAIKYIYSLISLTKFIYS